MTTENPTNEKLDFKRILPVLVIVLVDLMGLSIIIPLLPLYAARFGSSPLIIGILQAAYPMMQFLGAPILGRLSDRFGRKPILVISQIGTLAGFILLGFANSLWLLLFRDTTNQQASSKRFNHYSLQNVQSSLRLLWSMMVQQIIPYKF